MDLGVSISNKEPDIFFFVLVSAICYVDVEWGVLIILFKMLINIDCSLFNLFHGVIVYFCFVFAIEEIGVGERHVWKSFLSVFLLS